MHFCTFLWNHDKKAMNIPHCLCIAVNFPVCLWFPWFSCMLFLFVMNTWCSQSAFLKTVMCPTTGVQNCTMTASPILSVYNFQICWPASWKQGQNLRNEIKKWELVLAGLLPALKGNVQPCWVKCAATVSRSAQLKRKRYRKEQRRDTKGGRMGQAEDTRQGWNCSAFYRGTVENQT